MTTDPDHTLPTRPLPGGPTGDPRAAPPAWPDRYEVRGLLGRGGMADVYLAWDRDLQREVALKVLSAPWVGVAVWHDRLLAEARLLASLDHVGVVPVFARGVLPGDRPWYAMRVVRGRTMKAVLSASAPRLSWVVGRVLDVAHVLAHAHQRGIVHGDVSPSNIMIGQDDATLLLDWGLGGASGGGSDGVVAGTPGFVAPERREGGPPSPAADVFALGRVLERGIEASDHDGGPGPLSDLATAATAPRSTERMDLLRLRDGLRAWLDGTEARRRALAYLRAAVDLRDEADAAEVEAVRLRRAATRLHLQGSDREAVWSAEDRAGEGEVAAALARARELSALHAALESAPGLAAAHQALADHHHARLLAARARGDRPAQAVHRTLVERHDRGVHAAFLAGGASLSLSSDPPGARVQVRRLVEVGRRVVGTEPIPLGVTPLADVLVPDGALLVELHLEGHDPVRVPVVATAGARCGPRGADGSARPVRLWPGATVGPNACLVPAGWFPAGGDPEAGDGLPAQDVFIDDFIMQRDPVTVAEWGAFLTVLHREGRRDDLRCCLPLAAGEPGPITLDGHGVVVDEAVDPRLPITRISWLAARTYAAFLRARTGLGWRLPRELEWEKAARGPEGRAFPWGSAFEADFTRCVRSAAEVQPGPVGEPADDVSVYGVRGLGGNVRAWCADRWQLVPGSSEVDVAEDLRVVRGGSYSSVGAYCRSAGRYAGRPDRGYRATGVRLVRSLEHRSAPGRG